MMSVRGFAGVGRDYFNHPATQVVVYDGYGNPIVIVFEHGDQIKAAVHGEPDFVEYCKMIGASVQGPVYNKER